MKQKRRMWLLASILFVAGISLIVIAASHLYTPDDLPPGHYRVYVQGQPADFTAKVEPDAPYHTLLPFAALVESMGETVTWINDTMAHVTLRGETWVFDLEHVSLHPPGSSSNLLYPPPGYVGRYTEPLERDAYVDARALHFFLISFFDARLEIDDEQQTVRIVHSTP